MKVKQKKTNPAVVFLIVGVLATGGAIWYSGNLVAKANAGVTMSAHIQGNDTAHVKLVEYGDFECPTCGEFEPTVEQLVASNTASLSFEFRQFPLVTIHPNALKAAEASEAAAQQGKFWEMHNALYKNQSEWGSAANPTPYFEKYAAAIGLDMTQYKRQVKSSIIRDALNKDFQDNASNGLTGTPTFFLNGKKMQYSTIAEFKSQVEAALTPVTASSSNASSTSSASSTSAAPAATPSSVKFGL